MLYKQSIISSKDIIIRPVVNVSALTWFIRYINDINLRFLNAVIITKNYGSPPSGIGDFSSFGVLLLKNVCLLFGFRKLIP